MRAPCEAVSDGACERRKRRGGAAALCAAASGKRCVFACAPARAKNIADEGGREAWPGGPCALGKMDIDLLAGAPNEFEVTADASTMPDVYALLLTYMGVSILHLTKNMGYAVANTQKGEQIATVQAREFGLYSCVVLWASHARTANHCGHRQSAQPVCVAERTISATMSSLTTYIQSDQRDGDSSAGLAARACVHLGFL